MPVFMNSKSRAQSEITMRKAEVGLTVGMQNNPRPFFERTALTLEFFKLSREAAKLCVPTFGNRPSAKQQPSGH
jgi:hypothetical protein